MIIVLIMYNYKCQIITVSGKAGGYSESNATS